jgi:hypothetical protein
MSRDDSGRHRAVLRALEEIFSSVPLEQPRAPCPLCGRRLRVRDVVTDGGAFVSYRSAYLCSEWCGYWQIDDHETWTSDY